MPPARRIKEVSGGGRGKVSGVNSLVRGEASTLTPEQTCADKRSASGGGGVVWRVLKEQAGK